MHEVCIVGKRHLFSIDRPVAVSAENLSVVISVVCGPVLGIYEVCAFESLALVIFYSRTAGECRVQLVSVRMCDDELIVRHVDAFCK